MGNQNIVDVNREKELMKLVKAYVDKGAPARVIAAECGVNWGLFQHYLDGTSSKRMLEQTYKKLTKWIDEHDEYMPKDAKRCSMCGKVKLLSDFHKDRWKPDGHRSECASCFKEKKAKRRKGEKIDMANNNTEPAITAEIVKNVKAEDNQDVPSAMLAPYFGITPKQLDAIRNGEWDSLLYKKEPPKPAIDVKNAVEALRVEIADMHSSLNRLMAEMGCAETK